jgi:hypothetical protein
LSIAAEELIMDERTADLVDTVRRFLREVVDREQLPDDARSPLGDLVQAHLGVQIAELPAVTQTVAAHRLVDADLALSSLAAESGSAPIGVSGGGMRDQSALPELLAASPHARFGTGPVDYISVADGPDSVRRVMSFGLYLMRFRGEPVAALQRAARPERGRTSAAVEVLTPDPEVASAFLTEFSRRMLSLSVLRGQVLSFTGNEYGNGAAGATFLPRPVVAEHDVILPPGVLESVVRHVVAWESSGSACSRPDSI